MLKKLSLFVAILGLAGVAEARMASGDKVLTSGGRNAEYLEVYNEDNVAHEVGDVVVYKDGSYDGVSISTTASRNNALVAGVVAFKDIPAASWGIIQIAGYNSTVTCDTSVSAGDSLITSATGEASTTYSVLDSTATAPNNAGVFGVALADDSSSVCKVLLFR